VFVCVCGFILGGDTRRWTKSKNAVIPSIIHHGQNPLGSTSYFLFLSSASTKTTRLGELVHCVCSRILRLLVGSFLRDMCHVLRTKNECRNIANSARGEISIFLISTLLFDLLLLCFQGWHAVLLFETSFIWHIIKHTDKQWRHSSVQLAAYVTQMVSVPASHSGGPVFESRQGDWLS
jgi:hypothetical protein